MNAFIIWGGLGLFLVGRAVPEGICPEKKKTPRREEGIYNFESFLVCALEALWHHVGFSKKMNQIVDTISP